MHQHPQMGVTLCRNFCLPHPPPAASYPGSLLLLLDPPHIYTLLQKRSKHTSAPQSASIKAEQAAPRCLAQRRCARLAGMAAAQRPQQQLLQPPPCCRLPPLRASGACCWLCPHCAPDCAAAAARRHPADPPNSEQLCQHAQQDKGQQQHQHHCKHT